MAAGLLRLLSSNASTLIRVAPSCFMWFALSPCSGIHVVVSVISSVDCPTDCATCHWACSAAPFALHLSGIDSGFIAEPILSLYNNNNSNNKRRKRW